MPDPLPRPVELSRVTSWPPGRRPAWAVLGPVAPGRGHPAGGGQGPGRHPDLQLPGPRATSTCGTPSRTPRTASAGRIQPIRTNVPGIQVSELLPRLARQADRLRHRPDRAPPPHPAQLRACTGRSSAGRTGSTAPSSTRRRPTTPASARWSAGWPGGTATRPTCPRTSSPRARTATAPSTSPPASSAAAWGRGTTRSSSTPTRTPPTSSRPSAAQDPADRPRLRAPARPAGPPRLGCRRRHPAAAATSRPTGSGRSRWSARRRSGEAFDLSPGAGAVRDRYGRHTLGPVAPAGPPAGRGRVPVRHHGQRPEHRLGHAQGQLQAAEETGWCRRWSRPSRRLLDDLADRGPAGLDAGRVAGRLRPHARRSTRTPGGTTGRSATRPCWPAAASAAGRWSGRRTRSGPFPKTGRSRRPTSTRPCSPPWGTTRTRHLPVARGPAVPAVRRHSDPATPIRRSAFSADGSRPRPIC